MMLTVKLWAQGVMRDACCFVFGHDFGPWHDGHDGCYWRGCGRCFSVETRPYIEMLHEQRRLRQKARGRL